MSYAIIRNTKYTLNAVNLVYRHNERKNTHYSNQGIDKNRSSKNYSIKKCNQPYSIAFKELKEKHDLKGVIKKTTSKILCEYIITSDKEFFESIGEEETKRYFETAYKFVSKYKNLGEENIISARVHMDETTPHMHLVFVPVVHTVDKETGKNIDKISCSEFWHGKNSYKVLQDNFFKYVKRAGFDLERGSKENNDHIKIEQLKQMTNFELQKFEETSIKEENELISNDIEEIKKDYRRIIKKFNTVAKQYTRIKVLNDVTNEKIVKLENEYSELKTEYDKIRHQNNYLKHYIKSALKCVSIMFDFPVERLKSIITNFMKGSKDNDK